MDTVTMIDTVSWRVMLDESQEEKILSKSKEFTEFDHSSGTTNFRIVKTNIDIGSFDSNVTIKCYESGLAHIEFSLPKQYLGNNIELLYPSRVEQAMNRVYDNLVEHFGDFPHYRNWCLTRFDLCYAWRFGDQKTAEDSLRVLKTFDYPRKNKYIYKDSVMWRGKYFSLKFYLKEPEITKHDYKKLRDKGLYELAETLRELSNGVLRFEITFRKEALNNLFNKRTLSYRDLQDKDKIETILSIYLNKLLLKLDPSTMGDRDVLKTLRNTYSNRKALRLFTFYLLYNSPKLNHRQILIDHHNPSTIWRNKSDIAKAGVGLPNHDLTSFTLDIPSDLVVNKDES